jgi:hypothetical protein
MPRLTSSWPLGLWRLSRQVFVGDVRAPLVDGSSALEREVLILALCLLAQCVDEKDLRRQLDRLDRGLVDRLASVLVQDIDCDGISWDG